MEDVLGISVLGIPRIQIGESHARDFPTEKVKLLFFYLVLFRDVGHTRSRLAGLFWGDCPEVQARHSLSTALWRLRRWFRPLEKHSAPFLLLDDKQVAFNATSAYWLDAAEFEKQISWARQISTESPDQAAASLKRAMELYRGELLEGCYADWCLVERDRLHQLLLQGLLHLMVYHARRGEYAEAISYANRILRDDPLREEVQRELMKLFVLDHKPAEAIRQYVRFEAALHEELGLMPMPETQALLHQFVFKSVMAPAELATTVPTDPLIVQRPLHPSLRQIDAALQHFKVAQQEIGVAMEALYRIRDEMSQTL